MEIVLFFSSIKSIKDVLNAAVIQHPVVSCIIKQTNRDRANGSYSVAFSCFTKTKGKENCRLFDIQTIISSFIAAAVVVVVFLSE